MPASFQKKHLQMRAALEGSRIDNTFSRLKCELEGIDRGMVI
jgi:hypothetical protein